MSARKINMKTPEQIADIQKTALVQCLTVLRRIDRDNLTVGAGTILMTPEGIEPPLYGQMQAAIKASEAAIAANAPIAEKFMHSSAKA